MRSRKMCANPTCKDKSNQKITSQNRSNPYTQKCRDPDPTYKNIQYGLHPLDMWGSEVNQTNLLVSTSCPWLLPTTCSRSSSRHERVTGCEGRSFMRCEASIEYDANLQAISASPTGDPNGRAGPSVLDRLGGRVDEAPSARPFGSRPTPNTAVLGRGAVQYYKNTK
jgi:hypothetical protein